MSTATISLEQETTLAPLVFAVSSLTNTSVPGPHSHFRVSVKVSDKLRTGSAGSIRLCYQPVHTCQRPVPSADQQLMRHSLLRHTGIGSTLLRSTLLSRTVIEPGTAVLRCNRLYIQAASTPRGIDAASRRQTDVKHLARAFRPVPLAVVTVSKVTSRPAEDLAGAKTGCCCCRWHEPGIMAASMEMMHYTSCCWLADVTVTR